MNISPSNAAVPQRLAPTPGIYELVDASGSWTGIQQSISAGDRLPASEADHHWVCIDRFRGGGGGALEGRIPEMTAFGS